MTSLLTTLAELERRYNELDHLVADPSIATDPSQLTELGRERAELDPIVAAYREFRANETAIDETRLMAEDDDPELASLADEELKSLQSRHTELEKEIRTLLVPKDPNDEKNVIVEIRAGTGGEEAALFASDLFRMYTRYAERHRWKVEVLSSSETDNGGFRGVIFEGKGRGGYSHLRYESGVHRVQRVPATESQGRIHTSTASVAVLPEAEEVDIQINDNDLRIDVYRSTGHGGQSLNTTHTAERITQKPTQHHVHRQRVAGVSLDPLLHLFGNGGKHLVQATSQDYLCPGVGLRLVAFHSGVLERIEHRVLLRCESVARPRFGVLQVARFMGSKPGQQRNLCGVASFRPWEVDRPVVRDAGAVVPVDLNTPPHHQPDKALDEAHGHHHLLGHRFS